MRGPYVSANRRTSRRSIACRAHDAPQHTKIPSIRRLSLESVVVESKTRICTGVEASRHQYRSLSPHGSSFTGGERARITSRCRPRRAPRIFGGIHRPVDQSHVAALPGRHARYFRRAEESLQREGGRHRPRQRDVRHGSRGTAVRDEQEVRGHPQRLVQLPLVADFRHGRHSVRRDRVESAPGRSGQASRLCTGSDRRSRRRDSRAQAGSGLRRARRNRIRDDVARCVSARGGRRRACGRRHVRTGLHRVRHDLGSTWRRAASMC